MRKIYFILPHSIHIPANAAGGVEKVFYGIFEESILPGNIELTLIGRGQEKAIIEFSKNKKLITEEGYDWTQYRILNLFYSMLWTLKCAKYLNNSDLVIYNVPFGPIIHKLMFLPGKVTISDARGSGKLHMVSCCIDRMYAISNVVKNSWPDKYQNIVKVIYNGISLKDFVFRARYDNRPSDFYNVLFVGRIAKEKGVAELIEAINILIKDKHYTDIKLTIIGPSSSSKGGDKTYFNECNRIIEQNSLEKYIQFVGEKTSLEIVKFMHGSSIFVTPSIWPEAFGLVNVEALATGLPVIGFEVGAMPELIQTKSNGYLSPNISPAELSMMIEHHYNLPISKKVQMEEAARKSAQKFSYQNIAQQYFEDIEKILSDEK